MNASFFEPMFMFMYGTCLRRGGVGNRSCRIDGFCAFRYPAKVEYKPWSRKMLEKGWKRGQGSGGKEEVICGRPGEKLSE